MRGPIAVLMALIAASAQGNEFLAESHHLAPALGYGSEGAFFQDLTGDGLPEVAYTNGVSLEIRDPRNGYRLLQLAAPQAFNSRKFLPLRPSVQGGSVLELDVGSSRVAIWGDWPLRVLREIPGVLLDSSAVSLVAQLDDDAALELAYCSYLSGSLHVVDLDTGGQVTVASTSDCRQLLAVQADADPAFEVLVVHQWFDNAEIYDVATASLLSVSPGTFGPPVAVGNLDGDAFSELVVSYRGASQLMRIDLPSWTEATLPNTQALPQSGVVGLWLWDPQDDGRHDWLVIQDSSLKLYSPSSALPGPEISSTACVGPVAFGQLDADSAYEAMCANGQQVQAPERLHIAELGTGNVEWAIGSTHFGASPAVLDDFHGKGIPSLAIVHNGLNDNPSEIQLLDQISLDVSSAVAIHADAGMARADFKALAAVDFDPAPGRELAIAGNDASQVVVALMRPREATPLWITSFPGDAVARLVVVNAGPDAVPDFALLTAKTSNPRRCQLHKLDGISGDVVWSLDLGAPANRIGQQMLVLESEQPGSTNMAVVCSGRVSLVSAIDGVVQWTRDVLAADIDLDLSGGPASLIAAGSSGSTRLAISDGATLETLPGSAHAVSLDVGSADVIARRDFGILRLNLDSGLALSPATPLGGYLGEALDIVRTPDPTVIYVNNGYGVSRLRAPPSGHLFGSGFE